MLKQEGTEKGRKVRTDCTCVESNLHHSWDSTLLGDCVRVLTRLIVHGRDEFGLKVPQFSNYNRRAKRRMLAIMNAKNEKQRNFEYVDLLKNTGKVPGYAQATVRTIKNSVVSPSCVALLANIEHYCRLTEKVLETHRAEPRKIKDGCFAKKRGLEETDMCRSENVNHRLRRFRAGIEYGISWHKRSMGLTRCMW